VTPPLRESDIGGEKEAPTYTEAEATRREQRRAHDRALERDSE
jgi:hypothetical protein